MLSKLPIVFCVTLALFAGIGLVAKGAAEKVLSDEKKQIVEVGVVGDLSDYMGIGILALQKLDSSRFTVHLNVMEEEEARRCLQEGELKAYFEVPEGFVESVMMGENRKVKYYTGNGQPGLGTLLLNEFSSVMSELLTKSQNAVYGMQSLCQVYGRQDFFWQATEELNILLIEKVLTRQDIFEVETIGVSDELSLVEYYICGFTVLFFLLFGMNGCFLFIREDASLEKLLAAKGMGASCQILSEWIAYCILMIVTMLGVFALLGGVVSVLDLQPLGLEWLDAQMVLSYGISMIPVMLMLTAMALLGHELAEHMVSGILLQFLLTISMGYISGCFYPNTFFPQSVQKLGKLLPSGVGMRYAAQILKDETDAFACAWLIGYLLFFLGMLLFVRKRKLLRNCVN